MKLLEIQGDVFVANAVAAITREDSVLTVTLRESGESFEYEFDDATDALRELSKAVDALHCA